MSYPSPSLYPSLTLYPGFGLGRKFALADVYVAINAVDVSSYAHDLTIESIRDEIDVTPLGAAYREFMAGSEEAILKFGMLDGNWSLHQTLRTAYRNNTLVTVEVRPHSIAIAPDNPAQTGDCMVTKFAPMRGNVGDAALMDVEMRSNAPLLYSTTAGLYPSSGLYPSGSLYPSP